MRIKRVISIQEDMTVLNFYVPNNRLLHELKADRSIRKNRQIYNYT